ncbi:MAG TPA: hypothetical protein VMT19_05795 [Thermoanaerobaculaceae bacterium]|nr:hypothetical protein [Thermoanaerobaculaceae bacterium]
MRTVWLLVAAASLGAATAAGQAVSEWRTARGLPLAVVEVAGGDVEHLAALVPADAAQPEAVAGFPVEVRPAWSSQVWSITVPALAAQPVVTGFLAALSTTGSAAVVALGPLPARDLQPWMTAADVIPVRAPVRSRCALAEGAVAERLGTPEAVDLVLALPQPDDARADLVPAVLALVRARLSQAFPDLRTEEQFQDGCDTMVVHAPVHDETPRAALQRLRHALAQLATTPPTPDEVARAIAACQTRALQAAVAGGAAARSGAERLALGGTVAGSFATPTIEAGALAGLARELLSGHPGVATLVERELRPSPEPSRTLENGVELNVAWVPGETGVVALALGGVAPRPGREILAAAATAAAKEGWVPTVGEIAGVPTLAVAAPAASVTDVIERLSESVSAARPTVPDDLDADAARALGLSGVLTAETLSVALAIPPEVETGREAAEKFFGSFASGQVSAGIAPARRGLNWTAGEGSPQVLGVAELPPSAVGLVALQVVRGRLTAQAGVRVAALALPGRLLVTVASEGGSDVPALDTRLGAIWKGVVRRASVGEASAAARAVLASLFGDAAQAAARTAAATFLPLMPTQADLLGIDAAQVSGAVTALPAWEALTRFARGPAPAPSAPKDRASGVRKSGSPRQRGR